MIDYVTKHCIERGLGHDLPLVSLSLYNLKVRGMEVASCGRAKKLITHRILRR